MARIPRDTSPDSSLALLSEGYEFVSNRCRRYSSDLFQTRLMLQTVYCAMGEEAARVFYDPALFTRKGSIPFTTLRLLQDKGSVQTLDGEAHLRRKDMFMRIVSPASVRQLTDTVEEEWLVGISKWRKRKMDPVVLHSETQEVLTRAVCRWAGLALSDAEATRRTREFAAMIDGAGSPAGPRALWGLLLRSRTEHWARNVIDQIRRGQKQVTEECAAQVVASHRDGSGGLLRTEIAAVELLNLLRPTVAVARFATFAALALHQHAHCRDKLRAGGDEYAELFAQEVRRYYPFFPIIGGRARKDFVWRGHQFKKDAWMLLDLYGTNHDPRIWKDPDVFDPERFREWNGEAYNFIPQGGGEHRRGHRCPGERITIETIKRVSRLLVSAMDYEVPDQDLGISLSRMPALPKSGFIIANVRRTSSSAELDSEKKTGFGYNGKTTGPEVTP